MQKRVDGKVCEHLMCFPCLRFHDCGDVYILIDLQSSMDVFYWVLQYEEYQSQHLIGIGLGMDYQYMLEYQQLIELFVSSYVVLLPLLYN